MKKVPYDTYEVRTLPSLFCFFFFFEKIQTVRREAIWSRDAAARQAEFSFWNLMNNNYLFQL